MHYVGVNETKKQFNNKRIMQSENEFQIIECLIPDIMKNVSVECDKVIEMLSYFINT